MDETRFSRLGITALIFATGCRPLTLISPRTTTPANTRRINIRFRSRCSIIPIRNLLHWSCLRHELPAQFHQHATLIHYRVYQFPRFCLYFACSLCFYYLLMRDRAVEDAAPLECAPWPSALQST